VQRRYLVAVGVAVALGAVAWGVLATGRQPARSLGRDPARAVLYVALGDSTVAGVGATSIERTYVSLLHARLRQVFPQARVANLGVSGANAADVMVDQLPHALALGPDVVTLSVGPNDITQGRPVGAYERDLDTILERLARETSALVLVNLIPDLALTPRFRDGAQEAAVGRLTVRFNEALARLARRWGAQVVDLYTVSQDELPRRPGLIAADGYHPSDAGYARWAQAMWEGVAARLR
jgi:lysophospholipase L1-like esterase